MLQCIARNGGTNAAYFADTPGELQSALGAILADSAKNTTTRTVPAYSPVVNALSTTNGTPVTNDSIYLASFNPSPGLPWSGDIQRQRYQCTFSGNTFTVPTPQIQPNNGDDFAQNLNSNAGSLARTYIAFQPALVNGTMDATTTIRPYALVTGGDGVGQYKAAVLSGAASAIDTTMPWQAMNVPVNGCPYTSNGSGTPSGSPQTLATAACATMLLDYTFAPPSTSFSGQPGDFTFVSRSGNAFGSIYHATPTVVGPPGSLIQDPGYVGFAATWANRKTMVYAATNDGLLHAFWADETTKENNEYWAMLLPLPMTGIYGSYPSSFQFLLDGSPVVKDVVWDRGLSNSADATVWHTTLVAGYGSQNQGYYAVDVTNPNPAGMVNGANPPADPPPVGPVFRWQLTKMPTSNMQLFGAHSANPAITTLYMDPHDSLGPREIGVAILPGGMDLVPKTQGECARWGSSVDSAPVNSYTARGNCALLGQPERERDAELQGLRPRPLGEHRPPGHGGDPPRLRPEERLPGVRLGHHRHRQPVHGRVAGLAHDRHAHRLPERRRHGHDPVLGHRRRRRDRLEVRRLERRAGELDGPALSSTHVQHDGRHRRHVVERRAARAGPARPLARPLRQRRPQRRHRHDRPVRHDRRRVRLPRLPRRSRRTAAAWASSALPSTGGCSPPPSTTLRASVCRAR